MRRQIKIDHILIKWRSHSIILDVCS